MAEMPEIERIQVLELQPDDVLLVTVQGYITREMAAAVRDRIAEFLPGRKCMVMHGGVTLEVLRENAA